MKKYEGKAGERMEGAKSAKTYYTREHVSEAYYLITYFAMNRHLTQSTRLRANVADIVRAQAVALGIKTK